LAEDERVEFRPVTLYPLNPVELPTFYSNYIGLIWTPDELFLEVSQLQPQSVNKQEGTAPAVVVARIIISRKHAERLLDALQRTIKAEKAEAQEG
jgi:hypothetical protein